MISAQSLPELVYTPELLEQYALSTSDFQFQKFLLNPVEKENHDLLAAPIQDLSSLAYQFDDLAFFCRVEVQLEKAAKFPVKFRLGEVQYVERLEGKY